jgi:hypothetical protein
MSDKKAPKPPTTKASKEDLQRFAKEVDAYEAYGEEPEGGVTTDAVPESEGLTEEEEEDQ